MSSSILNNNHLPTLEFANDMSITALQHDQQSKSGPAIAPADAATEREQLIAANQAFAAALKRALQSGAETSVAGDSQTEARQERYSGFVSVASSCVADRGHTARSASGAAQRQSVLSRSASPLTGENRMPMVRCGNAY